MKIEAIDLRSVIASAESLSLHENDKIIIELKQKIFTKSENVYLFFIQCQYFIDKILTFLKLVVM